MSAIGLLAVLFLAVNLVAFCAYGIDKYKARHDKWRIPEAVLLLLAFAGGGIGAYAGMRTFHHKTKHKKFTILVPLFMIAQVALILWALIKLDF